jgi:L-asparaginase II
VSYELLAEVTRSGLVESCHYGSVVTLDTAGSIVHQMGEIDQPMYPRSANKPAQACAMLRQGLPLNGELLALAAASHSGEDFHLQGVRKILGIAGIDERLLRNTPGWPLDECTRVTYIRHGHQPSSLVANCSGKHAAMLVTCALNGWDLTNYLSVEHPLQRAIRDTISSLAAEPIQHVGIDGCGAPLFALTLTGVARTFRALALGVRGSAERRVVDAIQAYPEWASGTTRDEARLIRAVPGLFAKAGAEGVYAAAFDDGRAVAVKICDGSMRARSVVMAAALRRLGVDDEVPTDLSRVPVFGRNEPVGEIRPALE